MRDPVTPRRPSAREGMVEFFLPVHLVNPKNQRASRWQVQHGRTARLRDQAAQRAGLARIVQGRRWDATAPKHVTFLACVWSLFDDDSLPLTMAPIRDALMTARLIHADDPKSGHSFDYDQVIDRGRRGVLVTVEALACP